MTALWDAIYFVDGKRLNCLKRLLRSNEDFKLIMTWKLIKNYDEDNNDDDDDDDDDDSSNNISAFLIKLGCPMQYVRNDYNGLLVRIGKTVA